MERDNYIGLKATKKLHIITEKEITDYLENLRQSKTKTEVITDRAAELGDELIIDYAGFVGDEQFAGGTAEKQPLTLGSGTFIPGFEEQLVGAELGSQVDVKVCFPEVYHAEDLAGKEAVFHCTVHEIRMKIPYEMDDSFAQNVAGLATLEEMRSILREQMQGAAEEDAYNKLVDELLCALAMNCGDEEPDPQAVEKEIDNILAAMDQQLQQQGLTLEHYIQFTGRSMEELREAQRDQAKMGVKVSGALDEICVNEQIEASEEDMEREFQNLAQQCGISVEQVKGFFDEESIAAIRREIGQKKAVAFVVANADVTVVES